MRVCGLKAETSERECVTMCVCNEMVVVVVVVVFFDDSPSG